MKATWIIFAATLIVMLCGNPEWMHLRTPGFHWYQAITYTLCHGSWLHFTLNMLALLSFGFTLERQWGWFKFTWFYFNAGLLAAALQLALVDPPMSMVGASGALFALFAAYVTRKPHARIITPLIYPLPGWLVLALYSGLSFLAMGFGWLPKLAHGAHLAGIVYGVLTQLTLPGRVGLDQSRSNPEN